MVKVEFLYTFQEHLENITVMLKVIKNNFFLYTFYLKVLCTFH